MARSSRLPIVPLALLAFLVAGVVGGLVAHRTRHAASPAPEIPPPATGASLAATVDAMSAEEIFRRAFWRRPSADDRILRTERREQRGDSGAPESVQSWRWFIELHPGPALLRALRDPDTFGLIARPPSEATVDWPSGAKAPPEWFPASPASAEFEVLQAPAGHLTVLYRASDNLLYATDHGQGFAAPARRQ